MSVIKKITIIRDTSTNFTTQWRTAFATLHHFQKCKQYNSLYFQWQICSDYRKSHFVKLNEGLEFRDRPHTVINTGMKNEITKLTSGTLFVTINWFTTLLYSQNKHSIFIQQLADIHSVLIIKQIIYSDNSLWSYFWHHFQVRNVI